MIGGKPPFFIHSFIFFFFLGAYMLASFQLLFAVCCCLVFWVGMLWWGDDPWMSILLGFLEYDVACWSCQKKGPSLLKTCVWPFSFWGGAIHLLPAFSSLASPPSRTYTFISASSSSTRPINSFRHLGPQPPPRRLWDLVFLILYTAREKREQAGRMAGWMDGRKQKIGAGVVLTDWCI